MRLNWKTMFSKWSIVLKCTIKLELTVKGHNCFVAYYVRAVPYVALLGFTAYGSSSLKWLLVCVKSLQFAFFTLLGQVWRWSWMVLLQNADCLIAILIVVRYSFLCYDIYWFLSQVVYGCNGHSGDVNGTGDFSPLFRCGVLRSYSCG
jgi:hypothetical protein